MAEPEAQEARLALLAAGAALFIAVVGLIGRATGVRALYAPVPGGGDLKVESAAALALLALALLARVRVIAALLLAGAAGLGGLSLAEYLGLPGFHSPATAQMPFATGICVLLLVVAAATVHRTLLRQLCALAASGIGGLMLVGFSYGTHALTRFSHSSMSVPAATSVVLISLALLATTPGGWLGWVWHGSDAGAVALRSTLPPVVLGLPLLTFVHMQGERLFWEDERVSEAGFVVLLTALVSTLLFRVASSLRLLDLQREQARRDLQVLNARLMTDVRSSYDSLRSAQQRIGSLENSQRAVLTVHDDVLQTLFASGLMLRTTLDTIPADTPVDSVQRTLDCMDDAVRAIRRVVEDLNDQLGGSSVPPT